MSKIAKSFTELVGQTPLLEVSRYSEMLQLNARIIVKIESFNPLSSVKDRVAVAMVEDAEERGVLKKDYVIVEPTSGNTGIGLAAVAASKGYRIILTMPETMSVERRNLLKALGAEIVLTEGKKGMKGAIEKARQIAEELPNAFIPGQFDNMANVRKHKETTAKEIIKDTDGKIDFFVAGIGTGGTITGVGEALKEYNSNIQIVGIEPEASPFLTKKEAGPHKIQGIGAGFKPSILNEDIIDEMILITNEDAFETAKQLARTEGILAGISSGAALKAATILASRPENKGKTIVAILPDTGERYLSTGLFD
ncbi:MAG: cysteine synthase A [Cellulosilyticaceae bacterium]